MSVHHSTMPSVITKDPRLTVGGMSDIRGGDSVVHLEDKQEMVDLTDLNPLALGGA